MKVPALAQLKKRLQVRSVLALTIESGRIAVLVIPTNEELAIGRDTARLLSGGAGTAGPASAGRKPAAKAKKHPKTGKG